MSGFALRCSQPAPGHDKEPQSADPRRGRRLGLPKKRWPQRGKGHGGQVLRSVQDRSVQAPRQQVSATTRGTLARTGLARHFGDCKGNGKGAKTK